MLLGMGILLLLSVDVLLLFGKVVLCLLGVDIPLLLSISVLMIFGVGVL